MGRVAWPGASSDGSEVVKGAQGASVEVGRICLTVVGWRGQRTRCRQKSDDRNSSCRRRLSRSVRQQLESSSVSVVERLTCRHRPTHLSTRLHSRMSYSHQTINWYHFWASNLVKGQSIIYCFAIHNIFYRQGGGFTC